jgi:hypothetical protein
MADRSEYHRTLAHTMAAYQPQQPPAHAAKSVSLSHPHEDASTTPSALCFPRFPELPTEIRLKIWESCLPDPRALEVDYGDRSEFLRCKYPPPIALQICRESRAEALKHYELVFDSRPNARRIYFDFSRDGLHFQHINIFSFFPHDEALLRAIGHDLARVRFMSCRLPESGMSMPSLPDLRDLNALQEISLLIPPRGQDGPDKIFVDPSTVTLSPKCSFRAIQFLETDRDRVVELWSDAEFRDFSTPKISIMSYTTGDYRVC